MPIDVAGLIEERRADKFALSDRYLNAQLVRVLRTLGFAVDYVRAEGAYLFDAAGNRYLDLLSGFGVFALGRNHPTVVRRAPAGAARSARRSGPARRLAARRSLAERLTVLHAVAGEAVLLQLRCRGGRGRDQVQPGGDRPSQDRAIASMGSTA